MLLRLIGSQRASHLAVGSSLVRRLGSQQWLSTTSDASETSSVAEHLPRETLHALSGVPEEQLRRHVVITRRHRNATTQGKQSSGKWTLKFHATERYYVMDTIADGTGYSN
jgi:hypothetical protein